ncbi:uncharacterized protein LOC116264981 isoform X2 [Nymphaea colorata]|uniref:uncharacterized protein LOC116264981 isoform X2 n=1 Tax=Nymphaea colorata TaxID=210225 RepID=UPI00129EA0C1|nr:uncharacterized protein LOC116264981 isoform X2 [Nymphaea colorata]
MANNFKGFEAIFGECEPEWSSASSIPLREYVFHVRALDQSRLCVQVTDFHSNTFQAIRTVQHLEDLKDDVGVGGSWLDFLNYLVSSISSSNVKLMLEGPAKSDGARFAKLTAQVSKGMPRISIPLERVPESSAKDAIAFIAIELYRSYKKKCKDVAREQRQTVQLTTMLSAEKGKNEALKDQLACSNQRKARKLTASDSKSSDSVSLSSLETSVDNQVDNQKAPSQSTSGKHKAFPTVHRTNKSRGAILSDVGGDADN